MDKKKEKKEYLVNSINDYTNQEFSIKMAPPNPFQGVPSDITFSIPNTGIGCIPPAYQDMKAGLGVKPPVGYMSPAAEIYTARAHQYGAEKYAVGNYLRSPPEGITDLERLWGYADALKRHASELCDSIIRYIGKGRDACTTESEAAYAVDRESRLPHLAHIGATFSMMVQQAVDAGLLPKDPGCPWKERK